MFSRIALRLLYFALPLNCFIPCGIAPALAAPQAHPPASIERTISAAVSPLPDANSPGFAVLVKQNGHAIFERGYGVRDLRSFAPIDPATNFRLASLSKQFTAMAVMLLVHDGKLRYNETLSEVFPEFPAYGKTITIRNLLNHTSGLQDYETLMDDRRSAASPRWSAERQITDSEVLALLENERSTKFPPGTQWAYSNSGYVVLGLIVAKVSGRSFPQFLHDRIFAPLKMAHSLAYVKGQSDIANRAYGHSKQGEKFVETDQSSTSATLGDGGIYTSLQDLSKWDDALARHALLNSEEMEPALTPVTLIGGAQPQWPPDSDRPAGTPVSYGFGWFLDPYRGHPRMWHYGDTSGFHTYIVRFGNSANANAAMDANRVAPEADQTVIVLCNRTDLDPESLALKIADSFLSR